MNHEPLRTTRLSEPAKGEVTRPLDSGAPVTPVPAVSAPPPGQASPTAPRTGPFVAVNGCAPVVFLSIKPHWANAILAGDKTVELRKFFARESLGRHLFLYATYPRQAVVGVARVQRICRDVPQRLWETAGQASCVPREQFDAYFARTRQGCAISLGDVRPVAPLALREIRSVQPQFRPPMSHMTLPNNHWLTKRLLDLVQQQPSGT